MSNVQRIAAYEILEQLGQGGFGKVYKAWDPKVGREVAIKVLTATGDESQISRFRVEATAAGNLRHKNIITIYEYGEDNGLYYMVSEYLRGRDLSQVLGAGELLPVLDVVNIMNQVAQGLQYAHEHRVVHRDVKPGNIMLLHDGSVKIMDFGIARLADAGNHRLTRSGMLVGTLLYMAPEQFINAPNDALCDIWAFGALYYELLAGVHPFEASDQPAIMYRIAVAEPAPLRTHRPDCPPELVQIVMRLLSKNREARYQSLEDVVFDTEPLLVQLRRERAAELRQQCEMLIGSEQYEQAHQVIRQILELDPSDRLARDWRDQLRNRQRSSANLPKVEKLVLSAEFELSQKRFSKAIQIMDSALQLDPSNAKIQSQLHRIQHEHREFLAAQQLLAAARADFEAGKLTDALFRASEAASKQPSDVEAERLVGRIRGAIADRDRATKLQAVLKRVEEFVAQSELDAAIDLLVSQSKDFPGEYQISDRLRVLQQERDARRQQQQASSGITTARSLIESGRVEEALSLVEQLSTQVPQNAGIAELLAFTRAEVEKRKESAWIQQRAREAWGLAKAGQFEESLRIIDEMVRVHPEAEGVVRVRSGVKKLMAESTAQRMAAPADPLAPAPVPQQEPQQPAQVAAPQAAGSRGKALYLGGAAVAAVAVVATVVWYSTSNGDGAKPASGEPAVRPSEVATAPTAGTTPSRGANLPPTAVAKQAGAKQTSARDTSPASATDPTSGRPQSGNQAAKGTSLVDKATETARTAATSANPVVEQARNHTPPPAADPTPVTKPPAPVPAPPPVVRKVWNGDDTGQLRWRGSLAAGGTTDLSRDAALEGGSKFPWAHETRVRVRVVSPSGAVVVDVQPGAANSWNLIRIRNTTGQAVPVVTLAWEIPQ